MSEVLKLKKSNCKNCYKCIRHCPVKSIRFSGNQAHIVGDECILCGHCFVVCPQNAKQIADGTETVRVLLCGDTPVVASVAPSFSAYFEHVGFDSLTKALKQLGFSDAEETAIGATLVKREYEKQLLAHRGDVIISSCCHSVNLLIEKYYPQCLPYLSPVVSPMIAHSMEIKRRRPNCKTVFIGPCLSKKDEAENSPVDAVLTFDELGRMLEEKGIVPEATEEHKEKSRARLFPVVGGILKTMDVPADTPYTLMTIDGAENCRCALEDIAAGNIKNCFIEMSACSGGCIGGPVMEKYKKAPIRHYQVVTAQAGREDFDVAEPYAGMMAHEFTDMHIREPIPSEEDIRGILKKIGKNKPEDELNCGCCGYDTCREKAIAVWQGKADISMCLPYLTEKTERFSNHILQNTPIGIVVVNDDLEVQQINSAAMSMLNVTYMSDVLGDQVVRILDPTPFFGVLDSGKALNKQRDFYAEVGRYLELSIVPDRVSHTLIAMLRDVTEEEEARKKKKELGRQTVEVADKVVDKQMRIVQEIASLLGETAAETKIALTKLKETISNEDGDK